MAFGTARSHPGQAYIPHPFLALSIPGAEVSNHGRFQLDLDNELQPDVLLRLVSAAGGNSAVAEHGYLEGVLDLIAEIAASLVSYEVHVRQRI
ncbi:MAG: hypothetical protein IAE81_15020 [Caldilineaceae bacterium]|jgi:hypothetical protein|nr:hypothetical protein [Caldilineaceae bacterium]